MTGAGGVAAGSSAPPLRTLRWWDVADVAALEAQVFGPTAWSAETFWSELAADGRAYWCARDADGVLLGYAGVAAAGPDADVQTVATAPAARGRGLGDALLRACEQHAERAGAAALLLEVDATNAAARRLYARHGFELLARRRDYYGSGADALVLRRRPRADDGPTTAADTAGAPAR
ncbi:ribosomal protein S18-alanine N-acetyltransferase [Pseudokineococcus basanitobsidens]|uniref:Ribosomal protein S18-alanine N-acetyltransferase n=1 Tax=Pseudokineococcus basanitobsidens TaxID=1926649 RepID=A0ABU8RH51_9ACTN